MLDPAKLLTRLQAVGNREGSLTPRGNDTAEKPKKQPRRISKPKPTEEELW